MKRFLLLVVLIPHIIFAEDIYFKVIETTPAWKEINFPKPDNISGKIQEGSKVIGEGGVKFSSLKGVYEGIPFQIIRYNNEDMLIYANSVIPLETQDLFEKELLYSPEKTLVSSVYLNAFQPAKRDIIYLQNKAAWDEYIAWIKADYGQEDDDWWAYYGAPDILILTQTTLTFESNIKADSDLLIKSIKKNKDGYVITVKKIIIEGYKQDYDKYWKWPNPKKHEFFNILLIPDGDFVDLYLENKNNLIDTFVFVNKEFMTQLNNLKYDRPVDLTNIKWPRRADGSMNYSSSVSATDINNTEETENTDNNAIAKFAKEKPVKTGSGFKIILIAGIAVLLGGGAAVFLIKRKA
jgi:hypothetical protein